MNSEKSDTRTATFIVNKRLTPAVCYVIEKHL